MELRDYLLDAMKPPKKDEADDCDDETTLDAAVNAHTDKAMRLHAASVLHTFAETTDDDLDDGETLADRLQALLEAEVDEDGDEELSDGELEMLDAVFESAAEFLLSKGIDKDDVSALLDDGDEDAAVRVRDALCDALPDGDDAEEDLVGFAFGKEPALDATKKFVVFSHGQKKVVRRRVSGPKKRMTPAQRSAFRKVRAKSHNSQANRMRAISIKKRIKSGIGMKRKFA